jgi:hypothetical protein
MWHVLQRSSRIPSIELTLRSIVFERSGFGYENERSIDPHLYKPWTFWEHQGGSDARGSDGSTFLNWAAQEGLPWRYLGELFATESSYINRSIYAWIIIRSTTSALQNHQRMEGWPSILTRAGQVRPIDIANIEVGPLEARLWWWFDWICCLTCTIPRYRLRTPGIWHFLAWLKRSDSECPVNESRNDGHCRISMV